MSARTTVAATARDRQLLGMESIAEQMPFAFANGFVWQALTCECGICNKRIPKKYVRGVVARQTEKMASIEASGACFDCLVITRFAYRLHDDGRITGPTKHGWQTWGGAVRRSALGLLKHKAGLILARLIRPF